MCLNIKKGRTCKVCQVTKEETTNFYFHSSTGYYMNTCKECKNVNRRNNHTISSGRRESSIYIRQKTCIKCSIVKDVNKDNFYTHGGKFSKTCKDCSDNQTLINRESRLNKGPLPDNSTKECIICREEKNINSFSFSKKIGYYSSYCKPCDVKRKQERIRLLSIDEKEELLKKGRDWHKSNKEKSSLSKYKRFDFHNNLDNDLTLDFLRESLKSNCTYCGFESTGLDRINNSLGHLQYNCVPCCWECNTAKMHNFTYEEMLIVGEAIKQVKNNRLCLL